MSPGHRKIIQKPMANATGEPRLPIQPGVAPSVSMATVVPPNVPMRHEMTHCGNGKNHELRRLNAVEQVRKRW